MQPPQMPTHGPDRAKWIAAVGEAFEDLEMNEDFNAEVAGHELICDIYRLETRLRNFDQSMKEMDDEIRRLKLREVALEKKRDAAALSLQDGEKAICEALALMDWIGGPVASIRMRPGKDGFHRNHIDPYDFQDICDKIHAIRKALGTKEVGA